MGMGSGFNAMPTVHPNVDRYKGLVSDGVITVDPVTGVVRLTDSAYESMIVPSEESKKKK